jgi:hypothetical protein
VRSMWLILLRRVLHLLFQYSSIHLLPFLTRHHLSRMRIYIHQFRCFRSRRNLFSLNFATVTFYLKKIVRKNLNNLKLAINFRLFNKNDCGQLQGYLKIYQQSTSELSKNNRSQLQDGQIIFTVNFRMVKKADLFT